MLVVASNWDLQLEHVMQCAVWIEYMLICGTRNHIAMSLVDLVELPTLPTTFYNQNYINILSVPISNQLVRLLTGAECIA